MHTYKICYLPSLRRQCLWYSHWELSRPAELIIEHERHEHAEKKCLLATQKRKMNGNLPIVILSEKVNTYLVNHWYKLTSRLEEVHLLALHGNQIEIQKLKYAVLCRYDWDWKVCFACESVDIVHFHMVSIGPMPASWQGPRCPSHDFPRSTAQLLSQIQKPKCKNNQ